MRVSLTLARQGAWKGDLSAVLTLTNNLRCRRLRRRVGFCNGQTDRVTIHTSTSLLSQDDLQVGRFRDVEEVLRVAAPELIFSTVIIHTLRTCGILVPLRLERLLNGAWKFDQIDRV